MSTSKFVDFKSIKAAVSMEQVLQHYGLLDQFKRSGNGESLSGPCPIHKGTNATQFRVSLKKNCWNCFSGCKGGNVLDFVAAIENVKLDAAALKLCEWFNLPAGQPPASRTSDRPAREAQASPADKPARKRNATPTDENAPNKPLGFQLEHLDSSHPYLTERGLTQESIAEFGLGYCGKGIMSGHIAIPVHNAEGQLVAYAGRWPGEPPDGTPKFKLPAGFKKSQELFNLHRATRQAPETTLVIVEGFFDCIKLWQHGVKRVVALMGNTLSPAQEELIRKHTTEKTCVIVMLDEDDAGRAGRDDLAMRLAKFCFVRVHQFDEPGTQPEHLFAEDLAEILEGLP